MKSEALNVNEPVTRLLEILEYCEEMARNHAYPSAAWMIEIARANILSENQIPYEDE